MSVVEFMNGLLGWMLAFPMWFALLILALFLVLIITLVQKFATDQDEMRRLKEDIKDAQKEMKKSRKDPKKAARLQKQAMEANMRYTKHSLKTTLYTIIPLIFIIAWVNMHFSYAVVMPGEAIPVEVQMRSPAELTIFGENVSVEGKAVKQTLEQEAIFMVSADSPGRHRFTITNQDNESVERELIVGERANGQFTLLVYTVPGDSIRQHEAPFKTTEVDYPKATPLGDVSIGSYQPGWLMTYFIFSIFFSIFIRKVLKVH